MAEMQKKLDYADAIADWFMQLGEGAEAAGNCEEAVKYYQVTALVHARQNRILWSPRLEESLRRIGAGIGNEQAAKGKRECNRGGKKVCLHVLSEAFPAGGHTAMATRWIINDRSQHIHCVALLAQRIPVPGPLREAVANSGGEIFHANLKATLLQRAEWLRNLAWDTADYVVLHIGAADVICPIAFGSPGGPPVILVNHAAHIFWTGVTITDLVVNCRGSALEEQWTKVLRGAARCATVPIPLGDTVAGKGHGEAIDRSRCRVKRALGVPDDGFIVITVGGYFKYQPANGLDFLGTWETILHQFPRAYLFAVGFDADECWQHASRRMGGRIRALGRLSQEELAMIHDVADLYAEGFPFGTTTSLLEAGLRGIPVMLAPATCPPPYGSDGVALDDVLERPVSVEEYKEHAIRLCEADSNRKAVAQHLKRAVARHHTGSGWSAYLARALEKLPEHHSIYTNAIQTRTPEPIHEYWCEFMVRCSWGYEATLEYAVSYALSLGVQPRVTKELEEDCAELDAVRARGVIPLPVLDTLCNKVFPRLRGPLAKLVFRVCAAMFSGALCSKIARRMVQYIHGVRGRPDFYSDYRRPADGRLLSMVRAMDFNSPT